MLLFKLVSSVAAGFVRSHREALRAAALQVVLLSGDRPLL
jgi:hypothetical protein